MSVFSSCLKLFSAGKHSKRSYVALEEKSFVRCENFTFWKLWCTKTIIKFLVKFLSTDTWMFSLFVLRRRRRRGSRRRWGGWRDRRGDGGQAEDVTADRRSLPTRPETLPHQHPSAQLRRPAASEPPAKTVKDWERLPDGAEAERQPQVLESSVRRRGGRWQTQDSQRAGEAAQERAEDELHGSEGRGPGGRQQRQSGEGVNPEKGDRVHHGDQRGREEAADDEGRAEEEEQRAETQTGAAEDFTVTLC